MCRKLFFFITFVILAGCTTYHGLVPISPKVRGTTVDTSPYFKWKPSDKKGVKYDFIIYEVNWKGDASLPGEMVYYKEGLDKPEHKIDAKLKVGETYLWAVRVRDGDTVEAWSKFDFSVYYVVGYAQLRNHLFMIEIITQKEKNEEF